MSKVHPSYNFESCCFAMPKSKEGTLRLAMNNYLKLPYIYTLESSFCGDEGSNVNYSIDDLNNIGDKLVEGICIYLSTEIASSKDNITNTTAYSLLDEIKAQKDKLMMILYGNKELMGVGAVDDNGS
jgi:hypothetical protein